MASEKMTISLEDFTKYFIKRWKTVLVIVFACTALFVGATKITGEEITVPHSEEYLYYEQESAGLEDYMKNSVLMQMNPTSIYERTLFLENISEKERLKDYAASTELWDEIESEKNKIYFRELLTWQEDEAGNVQLILRQVTEEECLEFAEYVKEKLENYDAAVEVTVGEGRIVKDENLQDEQLRWYSKIDYSKSLLLEAQAGYTIRINMAAAALTGVLTGGILSIVILILSFLFRRKKDRMSMNQSIAEDNEVG